MYLWDRLFGNDKIIDAGINGIDAMVFTDEEQSSAKMSFLKLYEPFKIAQRYIAMTFCPAYVFCWVLTFIIEILDVFMVKDLNTDTLYKLLQGDFALMVILILGFYFGGGAAEGVVTKLRDKNEK
tara:strand:+ start:2531 stop:2905 length:375 start_codon:yes stop_codon:yes gene_type:complete